MTKAKNKTYNGSGYVSVSKVESLRHKADRANEKLKAAGLPPIKISFGEPHVRSVNVSGTKYLVNAVRVEIEREVDSPVGSVEILAKSDIHTDPDNMMHKTFRKLSAEEERIVQDAPRGKQHCDHCSTSRLRSFMFTIKTPEGVSRIGSGCLEKFIGFKYRMWSDNYESLAEDLENSFDFSFADLEKDKLVEVDDFLLQASYLIETYGYFNASMGNDPTGISAFDRIIAGETSSDMKRFNDKKDAVKAYIMASLFDENQRSNDYFVNLRTIIGTGYLSVKQANLLASSIPSYEKNLQFLAKKAAAVNQACQHVGAEGDKLILTNLTVESAYLDFKQFGAMTKFKFFDESGVLYSWEASGEFNVEVGDKVNVAGTLKKHVKWESKKYGGKLMMDNMLTRCKFLTPEMVVEYKEKEAIKQEKEARKLLRKAKKESMSAENSL